GGRIRSLGDALAKGPATQHGEQLLHGNGIGGKLDGIDQPPARLPPLEGGGATFDLEGEAGEVNRLRGGTRGDGGEQGLALGRWFRRFPGAAEQQEGEGGEPEGRPPGGGRAGERGPLLCC